MGLGGRSTALTMVTTSCWLAGSNHSLSCGRHKDEGVTWGSVLCCSDWFIYLDWLGYIFATHLDLYSDWFMYLDWFGYIFFTLLIYILTGFDIYF